MRTKTIDISEWAEDFPGKEPVVVIEKMNFKKFTELQDEVANIKVIGKQQIVDAKIGRGKLLFVLKSLKEAPFEISEQGLSEIPFDLGEFIFNEADNFNEVTQKK